ncbi:3-dehydroquinate synthase [Sphingobacterium sp. HJSM2_6]|uniref:3-dehydroquinate synthase n=1 Tax=Sphingobacterium sp. HJSM2_6 TaxID=3366264 RepID=UPI003BE15F83
MKKIKSLGYEVIFDDELNELQSFLIDHDYSQLLILVDRNTNDLCLPQLQACIPDIVDYDIIEIDPGEENKNIDFCIGVWKTMLDFGADRKALMLNLGGGVVTDLGGFAAATFKRGIDFIHVPTTLLSQVDASVGGKTGIDLDHVKNIIGTFTQPQAVFISNRFLETLDDKQLRSGFAEVIKHGLIKDGSLFDKCLQIELPNLPSDLVYQSVAIKNEVITTDPFEKGLRKILNFGHTIGHAIEGYSLLHDQNPLLHGEAIAIGMICEGFISKKLNNFDDVELQKVVTYLMSIYPSYPILQSIYPQLIELMKNDKKNEDNKVGFALLRSIGVCDFNKFVDEDVIIESLDYYNDLIK